MQFADDYKEDDDLGAAVALFLFGDADRDLPGGYSTSELDERSPIKLIASFPPEFVLLGRATVLLKGIAKRLEVPFSLAEKWQKGCTLTVSHASDPQLPLWGRDVVEDISTSGTVDATAKGRDYDKVTFRQVASLLKAWGKGKGRRFIERVIKRLPDDLKTKVLEAELRRLEAKDAKKN